MRTVGLITEYNPFHNGHLHHLRESKRVAEADVAVAVMSGHFLQRGEPALVDKWVRAEMALAAGVDVVVELPLPFACNSAPHFALGAVQAFNGLGAVDALCFGSEAGDLAALSRCADLLEKHGEIVARRTEVLLRQGVNYPEARSRILGALVGEEQALQALHTPNNILGIEYLRALRQTGHTMTALTIRRIGAGYHDLEAGADRIASATGIRSMLAAGTEISDLIPPAALSVFSKALQAGHCLDSSQLHRQLAATILREDDRLGEFCQVENGLDHRLRESVRTSADYGGLIDAVKSRHLTRTRVQRLLAYVLLGIERFDMEAFLGTGPLYLHLLGCSRRGEAFLAAGRKDRSLPLISNYSRIYPALKRRYGANSRLYRLAEKMVRYELRASALYTLLMTKWAGGDRNRDFFMEPVRGEAAGTAPNHRL